MPARYLVLSAVFASACAQRQPVPQASAPAAESVDAIAAEFWDAQMARWPTWATFLGIERYDAALPDLSAPAREQWLVTRQRFRERLAKIDSKALPESQQLTAEVLATQLDDGIATEVCRRPLWDVDQLDGWQSSLSELATYQRLDSADALAKYVERLAHIDILFAQHIDNLREGLQQGYSAPRLIVERVIAQLEPMVAQAPEKSPFVAAAARAQGIDDVERQRFAADITAVVRTAVLPAWQHYLTFLRDEYLPKAREDVGVASNPHGSECYAALVHSYTGATLSPQQIHALGEAEMARLEKQMTAIAKQAGFADLGSYRSHLAQDPAQHVGSREALLARGKELIARATTALPKAFGRLPPIPIDVKAIETFREADAPAAYYYEAADDGSRGAYFYVNTGKPETRPLYNMEALAFHEAIPGHHLQISIAQGQQQLPMVRRHGDFTAFVEGWALYAELLADELGLYSSQETRFGMLNYQAWRAARLVVDTGMHALGWSREQAVAYMQEHLALPANEIANEIDRYIIWPGQALAYMLGRMEIQKLRQQAQQRLGPAFSLKAFHDHLLENGPLPLSVLATVMQTWAP